jgi:hypothetical protein
MPNPDGTRTRNEHRRELIHRMMTHIHNGVDPDEALTRAATEHREIIEREGAEKIAEVMKFLGIKSH